MCSLCKEEKSWLDSAYKELGLSVWNKYESPSISPWIYTQTSIMDFSLNVCYYWLLIFTFMTSQASFYLLFGPTRKFNNLVNNPVQNGGVFQFSLYPDLDLFFYQNTSYYRLKRVRFSRTANSWTPKAKLIRLIEIFLDTWLM